MNVVPRRTTPISAADAAEAVKRAWPQVFGAAISRRAFPLIMALVWIETARGQSLQNNNFGNITAGPSWPGDAWRPPWFDLEGGTNVSERNVHLHEEMLKGKAPSAFRAYATREGGALDFVRTLKASFPEVIEAAESSDPDTFRLALSRKYSGDYKNPDSTRTFAQLQQLFDPMATGLPGGLGVGKILLIVAMVSTSGVLIWQALRTPAPKRAAKTVTAATVPAT